MPGTQNTLKGRAVWAACPPSSPAGSARAGAGCGNGLPQREHGPVVCRQMCGSRSSQGGSVLTQRESVDPHRPGFSCRQQPSPSQEGTPSPGDARRLPAGPVGHSSARCRGGAGTGSLQAGLCWAIPAQPSFWGPVSMQAAQTLGSVYTAWSSCRPRGDWGNGRVRGAQDPCGGSLGPACWKNTAFLLCPGASATAAAPRAGASPPAAASPAPRSRLPGDTSCVPWVTGALVSDGKPSAGEKGPGGREDGAAILGLCQLESRGEREQLRVVGVGAGMGSPRP